MRVFIVMEIGWEYNDENYHRAEDAGGIPKVAYESKADAKVACKEMNEKELKRPGMKECVVEWHSDDNIEYITEFFEVREVELYCE